MATLTISYAPTQTASPLTGRASQEEIPGFVEATIRISAVAVAIYYAGLAIIAYPLVGTTAAIVSSVVIYSNISGIPVQDLIDRICDWCTPAQPVRRHFRQLNVPSTPIPVQATATLTMPVSLISRRAPEESTQSLSGSGINQSPDRRRTDESRDSEFMIMARLPANTHGAIPPGLLDSQIHFSSGTGTSDKKI